MLPAIFRKWDTDVDRYLNLQDVQVRGAGSTGSTQGPAAQAVHCPLLMPSLLMRSSRCRPLPGCPQAMFEHINKQGISMESVPKEVEAFWALAQRVEHEDTHAGAGERGLRIFKNPPAW